MLLDRCAERKLKSYRNNRKIMIDKIRLIWYNRDALKERESRFLFGTG